MKRIFCLIFLILCVLLVVFRANRMDSKNPLVSVVMPVYNREELVSRAVESILNQTYPHFEFVIVDDGSTDKTLEILRQYAKKDTRIRIVKNKKNCGIACARNRGMNAAEGKYIAVMDSDDWALPIRLDRSVAAMEAHPDVVAFSGRTWNIEREPLDEWMQNPSSFWVDKSPEFLQIQMMFANNFSNVAAIYRRDFFEKEGILYNENYESAEDYDLWKQVLLKGGKISTLGNVVAMVRYHSSNPPSYYASMFKNTNQIKKEFLERFYDADIKDMKWHINDVERCEILDKVEKGNAQRHVIEPKIISDFKQEFCPPTGSNWVYVKHPKWKSFVILGANKEAYRHPLKEKGTYAFGKNGLKIKWEKGIAEEFEKRKNGWYYFFESGVPRIEVKHPNWSDKVSLKKGRFCREEASDCGEILSQTPNKIRVKWDRWGDEIFKKDPKTQIFEYVKQP